MCEYRNMEVRSCNHCCSGRAIIITYSEFGSMACPALHIFPHYVAICGLSRSTHFPTLCSICGLSRSTYFTTLCCHLWPVPLYIFSHIMLLYVACPTLHTFSHYVAICGLSRSTYTNTWCCYLWPVPLYIFYHIMCHLWPIPLYTFPQIMLLSVACPALHISPHYVAICGLSRSTHFPKLCCHLWPVPLYIFSHIMLPSVACPNQQIFPQCVTNCTIFGKKLLITKCVTWFPPHFSTAKFPILRRIQPYIIIAVYSSSFELPVIFVRF